MESPFRSDSSGQVLNSVTIYQNGDQLVEKLIDPKDLPIQSSDSPLHLARQVAGGGPIMFTGRMDDFVTWGWHCPRTT